MATVEERKFLGKWFKLRFGRDPQDDLDYFAEWIDRFDTGHIERFMDSKSLSAWNKLRGLM